MDPCRGQWQGPPDQTGLISRKQQLHSLTALETGSQAAPRSVCPPSKSSLLKIPTPQPHTLNCLTTKHPGCKSRGSASAAHSASSPQPYLPRQPPSWRHPNARCASPMALSLPVHPSTRTLCHAHRRIPNNVCERKDWRRRRRARSSKYLL